MRFHPLYLLATALLTASCEGEMSPVRLDFIGSTGLTSSNRTVEPADTLTTRIYASSTDNAALTRLQVAVSYEPTVNPIDYPTPASSYDPAGTPNGPELLYLDSVLTSGAEDLLFQNRVSARTTSGTERWQYSVTDAKGRTARRAYRLTVRKADSLEALHSYTILARPAETGASGRRFLALRPGLLLPKFAINTQPANQRLVDLVFVMQPDGITMKSIDLAGLGLSAARWPTANRRHTLLRRTGLGQTQFEGAETAVDIANLYNNGEPAAGFTRPVARGDLFGFKVTDLDSNTEHTGLILITDVALTPVPLVKCAVKIQK